MSVNTNHLAVQANLQSVKFAMAKDKASWLALFHDDALVCDPVGKSMFDPDGEGHRGKQAIGDFFENVIAPAPTTMTIGEHRVAGEFACAVPMRASNELGEGVVTHVDMITVYHVDTAGLIVSLHAYWDFAALEAELAELFAVS